jgi:hypothetical protein
VNWVTWQGVKIDRIGCAWLIRRFIDPDAVFHFIARYGPPPTDATPFDIPGVRFSHHEGAATFRALLSAHGLRDPVLQRIAAIIDAADADGDPQLNPEALGLDLVLSHLVGVVGSDQEALRIGAFLFEALYAALSEQEA